MTPGVTVVIPPAPRTLLRAYLNLAQQAGLSVSLYHLGEVEERLGQLEFIVDRLHALEERD